MRNSSWSMFEKSFSQDVHHNLQKVFFKHALKLSKFVSGDFLLCFSIIQV